MGLAIFTASGTFSPTMYGLQVGDLIQVLVVGGGGGGGHGGYEYVGGVSRSPGGGLSGKIRIVSHVLQNLNDISVTIGQGGAGAPTGNTPSSGESSSFGSIATSTGGYYTANGQGTAAGGDGGYYPGLERPFAHGRISGATSTDSGGSGGVTPAIANKGNDGIVPFGGSPAKGGTSFNVGAAGSAGGGSGGIGYGAGGGAGAYDSPGGAGASGLVIVTW